FLARGVDCRLQAVDQLLVRRAEIGAAGARRVVPVTGRGRPAVEVAGVGESLPDDLGPDDVSAPLAQLAVGLVAEQRLRESRDDERIDEAEEHRRHDGHQEGNDEIPGDSHVYASLSAVMTTSMILMPTNGAMMPPTP